MAHTSNDITEFAMYLRRCTDAQVQGVYDKETAAMREWYARLAELEADRRGIRLTKTTVPPVKRRGRSRTIKQVTCIVRCGNGATLIYSVRVTNPQNRVELWMAIARQCYDTGSVVDEEGLDILYVLDGAPKVLAKWEV